LQRYVPHVQTQTTSKEEHEASQRKTSGVLWQADKERAQDISSTEQNVRTFLKSRNTNGGYQGGVW